MDVALTRLQRMKQGIVLFLSLLGASVVAATLVYSFARDALIENVREELVATGKMAAMALDLPSLKLVALNPEGSGRLYTAEREKLRQVMARTNDTRALYTLHRQGSSLVYMVDARDPADMDRDGLPDQSRPYDLFRSPSRLPAEVFQTGLASAEEDGDKLGSFWKTYIPLTGDYGKVESVLVMETNSQKLNRRLDDLNLIYSWALVFALIFSAGVAAFYAVQYLLGEPKMEGEGRRKFVVRQICEVLLAVCAVAAAINGIVCHAALVGNKADRETELDHLLAIHQAEGVLARSLAGERNASLDEAAHLLASSRSPWIAGALRTSMESLDSSNPESRESLRRLALLLDQEGTTSGQRLAEKQAMEGDYVASLNRSLLGVLVVVLGGFFLLRLRSRRDQALLMAVKKGRRAESDLGQIVDNIPVGLFTWGAGRVHFSNPAWRQMLGLPEEGPSSEEALAKVHPNDRTPLLALLEGAHDRPSVEFQFRVFSSQSRMRHVALKAVPIPGEDTSEPKVLAFTLDITDSVEVKNSLQTKGQEVELKNRMLAAALEDLEANLESVVRCLVRAVEAKDPYTAGHSERVMEYSLWIGEELGLGPYEMRVLELGTLVHDVGKIGIPDAILTKPSNLTETEYAHIQQHPELGVRILEGIGLFQDCMPIVRWHHERLNGSGYPDGLEGDEVPFLVRIAAVADVFDAMTSTRAYRAGIEPQIVLKIMNQDAQKGLQDPVVVEALERAVRRKGVIPQGESHFSSRKAA